jgi:hypothetical protein
VQRYVVGRCKWLGSVSHFSRLLGIMGRKLEVNARPQDGNNVIASSSQPLAFFLFRLAANMQMYSGNTAHPEIIPGFDKHADHRCEDKFVYELAGREEQQHF